MVETTEDNHESDAKPPTELAGDTADEMSEYFEVLMYKQDDVVYLSKNDIIAHQPAVKLFQLTPAEIAAAQDQVSRVDLGTRSSTDKSLPPKKHPCF